MYEIKPESTKTFITNKNIVLPRFQRKQTWDEIKNFQLCISVFKNFPIGSCILHVYKANENSKEIRYLLDGRQRRNALQSIYENPESISLWATKFLKLKNTMDVNSLRETFDTKINEYLETDDDNDDENIIQTLATETDDDVISDEEDSNVPPSTISGVYGLELLYRIIEITYKKYTHFSGFTSPFDFNKQLASLPYIDVDDNSTYKLNGKKTRSFILEYRTYCENNGIEYNSDPNIFAEYLISRGRLVVGNNSNENAVKTKISQMVTNRWQEIVERFNVIDKIDEVLTNCTVGLIEVKDCSSADTQKIFNIINSEGVKLTAAEILSAKTYWNKKISNPSQTMIDSAKELYNSMNIQQINDVVRWDVPATLLTRIDKTYNFVFKDLSWDSIEKKTEFEKKLTLGFKVYSGILEKGITKNNIDEMGRNQQTIWENVSTDIPSDLNSILKIISEIPYFEFLSSWKTTIMELTSDSVALDFILIMYFDWIRKGKPMSNGTKTKQFVKNAIILWDKLIYEYVSLQWRGSSDSKIASNIKTITDNNNHEDVFTPISYEQWKKLLNEIYEKTTINDINISLALMKPILYHSYCLMEKKGPDGVDSYDIDHIIPQSIFKSSTIERKTIIQDSLFNLGLLPKKANISKSDQKLTKIDDAWLKTQIKDYEGIEPNQYDQFSKVANYNELYKFRKKNFFDKAFKEKRDDLVV